MFFQVNLTVQIFCRNNCPLTRRAISAKTKRVVFSLPSSNSIWGLFGRYLVFTWSKKKEQLLVRRILSWQSVRLRIISPSWDWKLSDLWTCVQTVQGQGVRQVSSFYLARYWIAHSKYQLKSIVQHWTVLTPTKYRKKTLLTTGLWIIHVLTRVKTVIVKDKKNPIKCLRWNSIEKVLQLLTDADLGIYHSKSVFFSKQIRIVLQSISQWKHNVQHLVLDMGYWTSCFPSLIRGVIC